jgi:hypothetical protein
VLSNAKLEILQVFPGVKRSDLVLDNTDLVYPREYLQNLPLGVRQH